jgi:hypothetical protein
MANPSSSPNVITLQLTGLDGSHPVPLISLTLPPNGQVAQFIRELFPSLSGAFKGLIEVTSSAPISVTGLRGRYNERGDFLITTTPATNVEASSFSPELEFPHIVSGGGYATEFIILGSGITGKLQFNSQNGTAVSTKDVQQIR